MTKNLNVIYGTETSHGSAILPGFYCIRSTRRVFKVMLERNQPITERLQIISLKYRLKIFVLSQQKVKSFNAKIATK